MRDLIIVSIVALGCLAALRRPWIGVMLWTWLSIMNPHRLAWGIAYDAPLAAASAAATLAGFMFARDKESPFKGSPTVWLALFLVWVTASWLMGISPEGDFEQWKKVMKIQLMVFVGLSLLHTKQHIVALAWVAALSLAILGAKGGVFTLANGGNYRVWGPPGSFIADNNEFALSLVMTIPILRFLQMQLAVGWRRHAMTVGMLLCAAAALGSQSRGALLAITAMATVLWWRGKSRVLGGVIIVVAGVLLVMFMPEHWSERMSTIQTYEEDESAMGRISAWWNAWGIAKDHVFGVGFDAARPELFARYSPFPEAVHAAHSIYFQILGNHGFVGLLLFLCVFTSTFFLSGRLRKTAGVHPQAAWCADLGSMVQVSLIGYAVGGAFLSLAYFDLPYNMLMLSVLAMRWVQTKGWEREPVYPDRWYTLPGLVPLAQGVRQ